MEKEGGVSEAEKRRRRYGAQQDAETERIEEKEIQKSDGLDELYGHPDHTPEADQEKERRLSPADEAAIEEKKHLDSLR